MVIHHSFLEGVHMKRLGRLVRHTVEGDSDHLQSRQSHGGPKPQLSLKADNRSTIGNDAFQKQISV